MRVALYQPDIPQNAAAIIRLAACLGVAVDIVEPCGFLFGDRYFRRAGMDYAERATIIRHASLAGLRTQMPPAARLVLLTTRATCPHIAFAYAPADVLLLGRESSGVPDDVHAAADASVRIPMRAGLRSLNVAVAAAMVLGEALRQTGGFPETT